MKWLTYILFIASFQISAEEFFCQKTIEDNETYTHCLNQYSFYPRPIHFYVPKRDPEHLFVHFHGHNLAGYDHFKRTAIPGEGYGDYGHFLADSQVNGILVIPESAGNCTTYDQFFSSQNNSELFFSEIKKLTKLKKNIHFSGHSGAYRVLNRLTGFIISNKIPSLSKLSSIGLFDATYGEIPFIEAWLQRQLAGNNEFYFFNAFISGNKATAEAISRLLMKKYSDKRIEMLPIQSISTEAVLDQHFSILKRAGMSLFFEKSSIVP